MKAKGSSARAGDVIPYLFCIAPGEESAKNSQADRAKHPDELKKAGKDELTIDYVHYLANQVLPPIERLCDPIEGTDRARLAECLGKCFQRSDLVCYPDSMNWLMAAGLDPAQFRVSRGAEGGEAFMPLASQMSDAERFKDCQPFMVRCRQCKGEGEFRPVWEREVSSLAALRDARLTDRSWDDQSSMVQHTGAVCPACGYVHPTVSLKTQLEVQIRARIAQYYQGWTICEDPTCAHRTRSMGVYGWRCVKPGCRGTVRLEYTDGELHVQLRYFASLFDEEKIKKTAEGSATYGVSSLICHPFGPADCSFCRQGQRSRDEFSVQRFFTGNGERGQQIHGAMRTRLGRPRSAVFRDEVPMMV